MERLVLASGKADWQLALYPPPTAESSKKTNQKLCSHASACDELDCAIDSAARIISEGGVRRYSLVCLLGGICGAPLRSARRPGGLAPIS